MHLGHNLAANHLKASTRTQGHSLAARNLRASTSTRTRRHIGHNLAATHLKASSSTQTRRHLGHSLAAKQPKPSTSTRYHDIILFTRPANLVGIRLFQLSEQIACRHIYIYIYMYIYISPNRYLNTNIGLFVSCFCIIAYYHFIHTCTYKSLR